MPPGPPDSLSSALTRNIRTLEERRARVAVATTRQEKVVVAITSFMGSMPFVYLLGDQVGVPDHVAGDRSAKMGSARIHTISLGHAKGHEHGAVGLRLP